MPHSTPGRETFAVQTVLQRLSSLVGVLALVGTGLAAQPAPATAQVQVAATVDCQRLTRRQQVAQTVMTGIPTTRMTDRTRRLVRHHAGTVVLLGRNVDNADQLLRLTRGLRRTAPKRMLVAVDEEGGRVARLGEKGIVDRLPSARTCCSSATTPRRRR